MDKTKNSNQTCIFKGVEYSDGATTCQAGTLFECRDGTWNNLGTKCED